MRGQALVEYMMLVGAAIAIAAVFIAIASSQANRTSDARHETSVNEQLQNVQTEIVAAALAHDGYSYAFDVGSLRGVDMETRINGSFVRINSSRYENTIRIPDVNGSVDVTVGTITITKENGTVSVS